MVRGAAEHGREEYGRLRQEIRASPVVYGDETGWREDGRNGYLWSFSTPKVRYFLYRPSRGRTVVEEVLGDEFEGVLVSDFYGAYNVYQGPHQRCWTHLLRDIHRLNEQYPQDPDLARWSLQVREVYDQARAYPGPEPGLPETVRRARRVKQQLQYQRQLWAICKPYLGSDAPMRVLCQRVERFLPELFTFVAEPRASRQQRCGAEPASSGGEPEDQRRHPFGSGKRNQEHPGFPVRAWRLEGRNPYHALNSILSQSQPAPL